MGGDKMLPRDERLSDQTEAGKSITALRQEIYLPKYAPHLEPQLGARELLEALKSRCLLRAAAASAKRQELDAILKAGKIADQIDLGKSSLQAHEAVYLGDTPYDIEAA